MEAAFWTVVACIVGLVVSWIFYWIAARDLRIEAAALRKQTLLIMNFLENAKADPSFVRDATTGEPTSVLVPVTASLGARASARAVLSLSTPTKRRSRQLLPDANSAVRWRYGTARVAMLRGAPVIGLLLVVEVSNSGD